MPKLLINRQPVEVEAGTTLLHAARALGIEIPTLCHWEGVAPMTSCMLCVVRNAQTGQLVPACSTRAADGMEVETDSGDVSAARKEVLELIVSEHLGDCEAPCSFTCPANMNIPQMMRQVYAGDLEAAAKTVTLGLVLPYTLGHVCIAPCQTTCRRKQQDETMHIREMHRHIASQGVCDAPELLDCPPDTGKSVAVIGAGMAGMAAAWVLRKCGHACTVYEKETRAGGKLRRLPDEELPAAVLDAEIARVARLGVKFLYEIEVGPEALTDFRAQHDAVLLACGGVAGPSGNVFEAKEHKLPVRAVGNGKAAAHLLDRYLRGIGGEDQKPLFRSRMGRVDKAQLEAMRVHNENRAAAEAGVPEAGWADSQEEAGRCLHCDCRKRSTCRLRRWATEYGVEMRKYSGAEAPEFRIIGREGDVVLEPGKCIKCGLCVEIARKYGEDIGLTFIGRGFGMEIRVPFGETLANGIRESAAECIAACPTAAISWRREVEPARWHTVTWTEL